MVSRIHWDLGTMLRGTIVFPWTSNGHFNLNKSKTELPTSIFLCTPNLFYPQPSSSQLMETLFCCLRIKLFLESFLSLPIPDLLGNPVASPKKDIQKAVISPLLQYYPVLNDCHLLGSLQCPSDLFHSFCPFSFTVCFKYSHQMISSHTMPLCGLQ